MSADLINQIILTAYQDERDQLEKEAFVGGMVQRTGRGFAAGRSRASQVLSNLRRRAVSGGSGSGRAAAEVVKKTPAEKSRAAVMRLKATRSKMGLNKAVRAEQATASAKASAAAEAARTARGPAAPFDPRAAARTPAARAKSKANAGTARRTVLRRKKAARTQGLLASVGPAAFAPGR